jgi:hypothetical protein
MTMHFSDIARQAAADGIITPDEILALRREGWGDGSITPEEAEEIFAINDALGERPGEWCDFFVEAIGEYVLNTWQPHGFVTDEQAAWLIERIAADGKLDSMAELEMLVHMLERAQNTPEALKAFVLEQIEQAVTTGTGPTRGGGELSASHVGEAECRLLRRTIFAAGGDLPAAVSQREAEMLFRIKDAALGAGNAPDWKRLFVQGVGNYLMGFSSPSAQLSRERGAELEAFMADSNSNVGRFLGHMAKSAPNAFGVVFGRRHGGPSREDQMAEAARVTGEEGDWLDVRIHANHEIDEYDQALLAFIAEEVG